MNFELKIQAPQNAPVIWNYTELKADLQTALSDYQSRVYSEDSIAEAKEDRAKLNRLKKAINDERIAKEKEYMKPFMTFKEQAKELCDLIDSASSGIDEQVKSFEEKRVAEKREKIESMFAEIISLYPINFLTLNQIYDTKWENKSVSDKAIAKEITDICEKIVKDLEVIRKMPRYAFEAEEAYKESLDLNKALDEGERIAKISEQKAEAVKESSDSEERFEISFKCKVTMTQAKALSAFCKENGIVLQKNI